MDKGSMRPGQRPRCSGTKHLLIFPPGLAQVSFGSGWALPPPPGPAPPMHLLAEPQLTDLLLSCCSLARYILMAEGAVMPRARCVGITSLT